MIKSSHYKKNTFTKRYIAVIVIILICILTIISKLFILQVIRHSKEDKYVDRIVNTSIVQKPQRGTIFDRNGNLLATSIKKCNIFIDGNMIKNKDIPKLSDLLFQYSIEINNSHIEKIKKGISYIPIASNINENIALDLKNKLQEINIDCIGLEPKFIRYYPEGHLASHIIGKLNTDGNGSYGIEEYCNEQLSGEEIRYKQFNIGRKKVFSDTFIDEEELNGKNIYLTIDRMLQFILEQELRNAINQTKAKKAIGIIQNPNNGEILAMASIPDFDPNKKVPSNELLKNNAIAFVVEPGSTFKIVILSACLENKIFKPTDRINCENGKFKVANGYITDHEPQKIISIARAIEVSSNIGTAKMAIALGEDLFYNYIKKFGFDIKSGIELIGEEKGLLKETKRWSGRSLHTISFGQEISTTPLQISNAFCAIANGGYLLKPQIIKSIDNTIFSQKQVVREIITPETASQVRKILKGVVDKGTGKSAKVKGYSIAGKTGTAQKKDTKTGKYSTEHYYASFCGMIPADNPQLVIFISLDEPKGSYYAASVVAPVFNKVTTKALKYLKIPMDEKI